MVLRKDKKLPQNGQTCQIWWVNHGRTFSKAKDGGYLWAPMPVKGGNTFPHWESMTYVNPGDLILNFTAENLVAFGIAKSKAQKYTEESTNKNMKGKDGWRVDLDFFDFISPINLEEIKPYIDELNQSIDENQPFNAFNGVNNGYLFNFSTAGIKLITEKFTERIPEEILNYLEEILDSNFFTYLRKEGLVFEPDLIKKYILSLHARSLVLLLGKPGTGKTKLAINYAKYIDSKQKSKISKDMILLERSWYKLSYNDKNVINAFEGFGKKIDQVRITMLNDGLIPLGWSTRDLNQKKIIKELQIGDVIIAYQGAYTIGGIGIVTHPHFVDESGDAYDTFCESSKNFIRVEWIFSGPLKIKDFFFDEYDIPGFGIWVDTIHELKKDQVFQFTDYLEYKGIMLSTKKVETFTKNYELVNVGADWERKAGLFGKFNSITKDYIKTRALELILNAKKSLGAGFTLPFFLILDEMNMVEGDHYLADFLTAIESNEPIILHESDDVEQNEGIPKELVIPSNLFIIGTIGIDKKSQRLSQKVLDSANIIEFQNMPIRDYLSGIKQRSFDKDLPHPENSEINNMVASEILELMAGVEIGDEVSSLFNEKIVGELEFFQKALKAIGADVSFRGVNEILRYMCIAWILENQPQKWTGWAEVFDNQILQRLLTKIYGEEAIIKDQLKCLYCYCFSGKTEKQLKELSEGKFVAELFAMDWRDARYKGAAKKLSLMQVELEKKGNVTII